MRIATLAFSVVLVAVFLVPDQAAGQQATLTLAALEDMALRNNPTLVQARAQIDAAHGRARQAGLLPNPLIGYTAEEVSGGPIIRGGEHGFFLEQTIPLGGKLRLSRAIFEREAGQAAALYDVQQRRVLNTVRALFYEALVAERRVELREALSATSAEAVQVSGQLANVGAADRPDLLEAQIEARQAELSLRMARNEQRRAWQRLAQAVGDPALPMQPLAADLDAPLPALDYETVVRTLLSDSPELAAARAGVERARATLQREQREPIPDLIVRGGPRYNRELLEPGPRPVGWELFADVGVTVPLFNRNQGAIRAAQADLERAEAEVRRVDLALRSRLADVFERYVTATEHVAAYREVILPRADEAHRLYRDRHQEMAAAYPQVLIARRTTLQMSDRYLDGVLEGWQAAVLIDGLLVSGGLDAPLTPGAAFAPEIPGGMDGGGRR
jgi:cobalt-zinc-cadmium efflux system outer membrane protein